MYQATLKVEELFFAALELESSEARTAFLDRHCGDAELRREVDELLALDPEANNFLETPASTPTVSIAPDGRSGVDEPGTVIGPYRLMEIIGEGGMGSVYVAEQARPVRRKVALKVIKPGMDSRQVIARFEAERQALAMMDHPNIARVLDGGTTDAGRPYFVMELVRGTSITHYCDREHLSIPERLELFVLVCRAVQHAHQKGIIHRDLKPSNILVTVVDGAAVPKVIDFGVAKATGASLTERTVYTGFQQLIGTPLYMSPEQADLSGVDIDTRSDVYALGVLLYELLTGTTPFDQDTLRRAAFDEIRRIIREQVPPTPSTRLSSLGAERRLSVSAARHSDPRHVGRSLRGELDWIVMKAMEKDRRRRYETANDFAADVMQYLTDRPVQACPPSAWYRFGKAARRHRVALATGTLVALSLVVGTVVSLWQAAQTAAVAQEADRRAEELRQIVSYLVDDVYGAERQGRDRSVTVGELLDRANAEVGERFRGKPLVEASVRLALSRAFQHLWDQGRAETHAARAVDLRAQFLGPEHPDTLEALYQLATVHCDAGWADHNRRNVAVAIARRVLTSRRRVLGPTHPDTLGTQSFLAYLLLRLDRLDEAQVEAEQAHSLALRKLGPDHLMTLATCDALGQILVARGDRARGEAMLRRLAEGRQLALGALAPETIGAFHNLADSFSNSGRLDEARALYLEVVERNWRVLGPCHVGSSSAMAALFSVLRRQGDFVAIRDLTQDWLRQILTTPPDPAPYQRDRRNIRLSSLAHQLVTLPDLLPIDVDLAARLIEETRGTSTPGLLYYRLGRLDEAEVATRELMRDREGGSGLTRITMALIADRRGHRDQALELLEAAAAWFAENPDPSSLYTFELFRSYASAERGLVVPHATPGEDGGGK